MMPQESYASFAARLRDRARPARVPLSGTIEVTDRCPLSCAHCYNNLPMDDAGARRRELTLEEHRRILDEAAGAGCLWLLLTGGEVLARPDFLEILAHARARGLLVTVFTSGTLITPRVAAELARLRPLAIEITLYGRTRETYESLTGVPGSHERCLRGIRLLLERRLPLKLKTVAVTLNRHELPAMRAFAEELGVPFKFDSLLNPRTDCSRSPLEVRLDPEEVVEMDLRDPVRRRAWREAAARERRAAPAPPGDRGRGGQEGTGMVYGCGGGLSSFAIDPYGKLSICVLSREDEYDLRAGSFREGWEGFLRKVRERRASRVTKCTACRIRSLCGMCPANGELENGDPEEPVEFLCRVAHLRALALGAPIAPHGDCAFCREGPDRRENGVVPGRAPGAAGPGR